MTPEQKELYQDLCEYHDYTETEVISLIKGFKMLISIDLFTDFRENDKGLEPDDHYYLCGLFSLESKDIDPFVIPADELTAYYNKEVITEIFTTKTDALEWMHKMLTVYI